MTKLLLASIFIFSTIRGSESPNLKLTFNEETNADFAELNLYDWHERYRLSLEIAFARKSEDSFSKSHDLYNFPHYVKPLLDKAKMAGPFDTWNNDLKAEFTKTTGRLFQDYQDDNRYRWHSDQWPDFDDILFDCDRA